MASVCLGANSPLPTVSLGGTRPYTQREESDCADPQTPSINVTVDLIFALFPLLVIRGLQMRGKFKLATYLLLSCGLLACVCSIGRVAASKLSVQDVTCESPTRDIRRLMMLLIKTAGELIPLTYWALSEATGVLILACMPAMYQIVLRFSRSSSWVKMKAYMTRKLPGSTQRSSHVNGSGHAANQRRDPITLSKDVHVRRDIYVELNDSVSSNEAVHDTFRYDRRMYSSNAQGTTTMV